MAGRNRGLGGENVYFLRITTRKHGRVQESCDSLGSIVGDASEGLCFLWKGSSSQKSLFFSSSLTPGLWEWGPQNIHLKVSHRLLKKEFVD